MLKVIVEIDIATKAVVKNQCLIKYLTPNRDVLDFNTALVNETSV